MTTQEFECNAEDLKEIKELGHGAYGYVYKMLHEPTGNIMAVKVLNDNTLKLITMKKKITCGCVTQRQVIPKRFLDY